MLENSSATLFEQQFKADFEQLSTEARREVAASIQELTTDYLTAPWNHPRVKYIPSQGEIWRLKVKKEHTDHRVFFDIGDEGLIFLAIAHRDTAYE